MFDDYDDGGDDFDDTIIWAYARQRHACRILQSLASR
jgi:hypothetical protein